MPPIDSVKEKKKRSKYDPALGDDDLYAGDLTGRMWRLMMTGCVVLALLLGLGMGIAASRMLWDDDDAKPTSNAQTDVISTARPTAPPTSTPRGSSGGDFVTATPPSPEYHLSLSTITPGPPIPSDTPTPTITPTPGPCYQTAQSGDTVWGMAIRCGHGDMAIVDVILEMNDMDTPQELQLGQTLTIPWPTPTAAPGVTEDAASSAGTGGGDEATGEATQEILYNEFGTPDIMAQYANIEPTLRPGMAWHVVQPGETILGVAMEYDTTVNLLSQINPEIPFYQCEANIPTGGPNCVVLLGEGQRVRVPVPLPSITPTPSPVGTLTPTPTATPTFNAPYVLGPDTDAHFNADEIITLRWGGTGTLGTSERYVVRVRDLQTGEVYLAAISDAAYILPGGWQPSDGKKHEFEWTISTGLVDPQNNILQEGHATEPRKFTWESR